MQDTTTYTKGFGTNFHSVYNEKPDLYNQFSAAEFFSEELDIKLKSLFKGDIALDIGCGTCHKTNMFSSYFEKIYALDLSEALISFAKEKYTENNKMEYIVASAANIPLKDNSIDTIISTWASLPLEESIAEMKRVVKEGGSIIRIGTTKIDEFTELFPKYSLDRIQEVNHYFKDQGFIEDFHTVKIKFSSIEEAKYILANTLGIDPEKILKDTYMHTIVLHYIQNYKK
jgi:ubiquinone/menaquinone biosynthesis C-methylase UbiE